MEVTLVEKGRHKFKYLKTKSDGKMNDFFVNLYFLYRIGAKSWMDGEELRGKVELRR